MPGRRLKIYFDGGCRPNPGRMEAAVVARGVVHHWADLGQGSNTDAEWLALIHALRVAQALGDRDFELVGDSAVVVEQAIGTRRCRNAGLQAHLDTFRALAAVLPPPRIRRVARSQNLAGIALAKRNAGL